MATKAAPVRKTRRAKQKSIVKAASKKKEAIDKIVAGIYHTARKRTRTN